MTRPASSHPRRRVALVIEVELRKRREQAGVMASFSTRQSLENLLEDFQA